MLLQILHGPPSLRQLVVVRDKLRPKDAEVKRKTPTSCGAWPSNHNIMRKWSHFQSVSKERSGAAARSFPPVFHRISDPSRQLFHSVLHKGKHADSAETPRILRRICTGFHKQKHHLSQLPFRQLFRLFSGVSWQTRQHKKGAKRQRESKPAEK